MRDIRTEPVKIKFSSPDSPHLLIGGRSGSGKSVALKTILDGLITNYDPSSLRMVSLTQRELN